MMKTIKKRLNLYTINILIGWGSCLFLEFTFVFFTSNIQSPCNTLAWKGKLSILTTCVGPILNAY